MGENARYTEHRLGSLLTPRSQKNRPDLPLLSVVRERGIILRDASSRDSNHNVIPTDLSNYKLVMPGDLVVNKMKAWSGSLGVSDFCGIVSPAYFVFRTRFPVSRFAHYLLRSRDYVDEYARRSKGVRVGQWDLSPVLFKDICVKLPTVSEQDLIVRYLDNAELRIQKAIRAKQNLIALLAEQRAAMVCDTLSGHHLPGEVFIDSQVPGLGSLPESWPIVRAKDIWRAVDRRSKTGQEERLSVSSSSGVVPRSSKTVTMFEAKSYVGHKVVHPGELVINSLWAWAGGLGVSNLEGIVSPVYGVYALRRREEGNVSFFHELFRSNLMQWQFQTKSKGIWRSRLQLSPEAFGSLRIPNPPLAVQDALVSVIDSRTSSIDRATSSLHNEIDLLKEYRTRLISDVVTGSKDIRAQAKGMKDVDPEELQALYTSAPATDEENGEADEA